MDIKPRERLILALDVASADEAKRLVDRIGQEIAFVKIGLELFTAAGPEIVRWALENGKQVFLDLKLLDIDETVKRATAAGKLDVARFAVLRTGADFDRPYPGQSDADALVNYAQQGGFVPAVNNLYNAGSPWIADVVARWPLWRTGVPN